MNFDKALMFGNTYFQGDNLSFNQPVHNTIRIANPSFAYTIHHNNMPAVLCIHNHSLLPNSFLDDKKTISHLVSLSPLRCLPRSPHPSRAKGWPAVRLVGLR